jgi:hypothetical protein
MPDYLADGQLKLSFRLVNATTLPISCFDSIVLQSLSQANTLIVEL